MEANPSANEGVVGDLLSSEATSSEARTLNSRENEPVLETEDEAIKENPLMFEKDGTLDDKKVTPAADTMEVPQACTQTEDAEIDTVEAVTSHEATKACAPTSQYDNAEITLVVEVNTDAETMIESGGKGEGIMQGEADTLVECGATLQVGEQVGASQFKEEGTGASPAVIYEEHTETKLTENMPQQTMGKVQTPDQQIEQNEPATSDMLVEVETQSLAFKTAGVRVVFLSEDETKGSERKEAEGHVLAEAQIGQDAERSIGEGAGTPLEVLETKAEDILTVVSGSSDAMEGVENNEGGRKGEAVGGCMDMVVEAGDTGGCMDMEAAMEANIRPCSNDVSAGIVDEREKNGMAGQEPIGAEEMIEIRKEHESGSTMVQMELGANKTSSENEVVQAGSQNSKGTDGVREGMEATLVPTEDKEVVQVEEPGRWSGTPTGMDADTIVSEKQRLNVKNFQPMVSGSGERANEGMQEMHFETEADTSGIVGSPHHMDVERGPELGIKEDACHQSLERNPENRKEVGREVSADHIALCSNRDMNKEMDSGKVEQGTLGTVPLQHHMDVERGPELGIKEDACHQSLERNTENGKEVGSEVSADHIALCSNKDINKEMDSGNVEQGGPWKEEAHHLVGQDSQGSPAIQGLLQNLKSKNIAFATSVSEDDRRVQRERHHNRQVHAEMQIRLLPDKSVQADLIKSHEVLGGSSGMKMLKELPFAKSKEVKDDDLGSSAGPHWRVGIVMQVKAKTDTTSVEERPKDIKTKVGFEKNQGWGFQGTGYENAAHGISRGARVGVFEEEKTGMSDEANTGTSEEEKYLRAGFEKEGIIEKASQKRKLSENLASDSGLMNELGQNDNVVKKAKKKAANVWAKSTSRKGPKKNSKNGVLQNPSNEDSVLLTPVHVNPDKLEDGPDQPIALSKHDKAEKIEVSENRLTASSTKGYRMVRATRGVQEGTWYFEIVVEQLGPTGHTRLGWSTQKGDVQAPVGFDNNSYGYRDLDGSKTHVAIREPYGDLYVEGDVIGFYIHLPDGAEYAPKPAPLLSYRGRPYLSDIKEEQPRKVPGSEICFFRNGVCQGTAFRDINAGRYFPAASMYTLPKEPSCIVRFNFGPEFRFPPVDIGDRPAPVAMVFAPYHNAMNGKEAGSVAWATVSATGNASLNNEPQIKIV